VAAKVCCAGQKTYFRQKDLQKFPPWQEKIIDYMLESSLFVLYY
jgi:hypothetical protein